MNDNKAVKMRFVELRSPELLCGKPISLLGATVDGSVEFEDSIALRVLFNQPDAPCTVRFEDGPTYAGTVTMDISGTSGRFTDMREVEEEL